MTAMRFKNRESAGLLLAAELSQKLLIKPLVLGIPRGGIVVAAAIASKLNAELDVALSRKLPVPWQPELALGAISEDGVIVWNAEVAALVRLAEDEINYIRQSVMQEIANRRTRYRMIRPQASVQNRTVILTDDGLATGATMKAAIADVRSRGPAEIILALPVASSSSLHRVANDADDVVCLWDTDEFMAVGCFYDHFDQVDDLEVERLLMQAWNRQSAIAAQS